MKKIFLPKFSAMVIFLSGFSGIIYSPFNSAGQIIINSNNMPQQGKTYYAAKDTTITSAGTAGANQNWDFSGWLNQGTDTNSFDNPSNLQGFSSFPNSNLGLITSGANLFLNNNSNSLDILGFYGDFGGGPAPVLFTPSEKFISFPSTYQTTFSGTTMYKIEFPYTQQPPIDSIRVISNIVYSSEIDGWGMITTPAFQNVSSLRQKVTEYKTDSTFVHMFGSWNPAGSPTTDTTITFRWWSDTKEFPLAEIEADGNGMVTKGTYQIPTPAQAQISFSANPTSGCAPLTVTFTNNSSGASYYQWNFGDGGSYFGLDTSHTFNAGGNYWISLSAYDANFNFVGNAYEIIFVGGSSGFFEMASDSVCPGDKVNFKGQDGAFNYDWAFGDGSTESGQQWAEHTYTNVGNYTVSLVVSTSCGVDTIYQNLFVGSNVVPDSGFGIWPNEVCPNQPVNLYSSAVGNNYQWNFGDGNSGNGQNTMHGYPNIGNYTITCNVTNSCGNSSSGSGMVSVTANAPFQQGIGLYNWPQTACPGTEIFINGPNGMASYIWNYGDGTPLDTTAANEVTHSFSGAGMFNVSVAITNYCGKDTTLSTMINIDNNVPFSGMIDLNVNPSPACPGSNIYFEAWSSDAKTFLWNFGDGDSSTFESAGHSYPTVGSYNATLTMTNQCGNDTVISFVVDVNNNVIPNPSDYGYGVAVDTACSGDSILFYIQPAGSGTYLWNFGDGTSTTTSYLFTDGGFSIDIAPHVYATNGTFKVLFTLTNQCNKSFTDSFMVTIGGNVPVDGDFWSNGGMICQGDSVKFNALGGANYIWNYGDGSPADTTFGTITDAFHAYLYSGDYPVSVKITNSCGNNAIYSDTVTIDSCAVGIIQNSITNLDFDVFPNPNSGEFTVKFTHEPSKAGLEVYNLLGEKVFNSPLLTNKNNFDLSMLGNGIYLIKISEGNNFRFKKIIKE